MTEREAYVALNMMEKIGPVGVRSLADALGSVEAILEAGREDLLRARGVGRELAREICEQRADIDWRGELERADAIGARLVTPVDSEYPAPLLEIHDPPLALYVQGSLQESDKHALAIVGTRRPSHYGRSVAERLGAELARAGFTIVSGLARGIDTAAHEGALKVKGRTFAVLGGALDCLYPECNRDLAETISSCGAVLTEFPLGRRPDKTTFPMRNRIVSGLSMGIVVVEAGVKSGALITAKAAAEHGRTVFAVPGRIDAAGSAGPHGLIRDGAVLVSSPDDVLGEFELLFSSALPAARNGGAAPGPALSEPEAQLMGLLEEGEQHVDALIRGSGLKASVVSSLLLGLEMKKAVRMLPGRIVEKTR